MKLRIFLVVASCVVSLITGFVISRSGSPIESVRARAKPLIGLSMDTLKEERWQGDHDLFVTGARELGADVLVQSADDHSNLCPTFKKWSRSSRSKLKLSLRLYKT